MRDSSCAPEKCSSVAVARWFSGSTSVGRHSPACCTWSASAASNDASLTSGGSRIGSYGSSIVTGLLKRIPSGKSSIRLLSP
ncbi:hypothetical protein BE21_19115 [Sorangium cellulosum]|uniref:Uncharacterized protein n=1 Tax=Sorangium cellulosum TaxID=56 RepID=A0A150TX08_SORCE|nr:hypothetical protein BE21_19115 [Sorangium cellulosum]